MVIKNRTAFNATISRLAKSVIKMHKGRRKIEKVRQECVYIVL